MEVTRSDISVHALSIPSELVVHLVIAPGGMIPMSGGFEVLFGGREKICCEWGYVDFSSEQAFQLEQDGLMRVASLGIAAWHSSTE